MLSGPLLPEFGLKFTARLRQQASSVCDSTRARNLHQILSGVKKLDVSIRACIITAVSEASKALSTLKGEAKW